MAAIGAARVVRRGCWVVLAVISVAPRASAQECANPKPEWLFCDDFESQQDQNGNLALWDDQGLGPQNLVITTTPANVHRGARALEITAHKGQDTGGGPTKWYLPGKDDVYIRFWTRFATDFHYLHHMVFIGASQASDKWSAFGTAGCRPSGTNFFVTQVEPFGENGRNAPPGAWGFYTYSNDMTCDPGATCANYNDPQQVCNDCDNRGSPCTNGLECCWGANDIASPPVISALGAWTCLEARVQANTNGQSNGVQTLWVDGSQVGQWSGIRFRTDDALKINSLGLWHYSTDDVYAAGQTEETLWFDDVVVSTAPIGCGPGADGGVNIGAGGTQSGGLGGAATTSGGRTGVAGSSGGASASGATGSSVASSGGAGANGGTASSGGSTTTADGGPRGGSGAAATHDDSGCGCRTAQSTGDRPALGAVVGLSLLALRRRFRPRSRVSRRAGHSFG